MNFLQHNYSVLLQHYISGLSLTAWHAVEGLLINDVPSAVAHISPVTAAHWLYGRKHKRERKNEHLQPRNKGTGRRLRRPWAFTVPGPQQPRSSAKPAPRVPRDTGRMLSTAPRERRTIQMHQNKVMPSCTFSPTFYPALSNYH